MFRRMLSCLALTVMACMSIPVAIAPASAPSGANPPAPIHPCLNGGWRTLSDASGAPFGNERQRISYAIHHTMGLADLAGSLTGTFLPPFGATVAAFWG